MKWSKEQLDLLLELYPNCNKVDDLVTIIDRDWNSIYAKANSIKLKRNLNSGNLNLKVYGEKFRFPKNHEPWNKGVKGLQIGGKETQFKKGSIPLNTKFFGKPYLVKRERNNQIEKFWVIQELGFNKRQVYSRYLWRQEFGEIPKGYIVFYKNGVNDLIPPTIKDLGLMSMSDNMNRNTIQRFPDEIKKTIRVIKKLEKIIKNETN